MNDALVGNAGDPEQVKKAAKKEQFNERVLDSAWARLMQSSDALVVFGDFFTQYGAFTTPFDPNPSVMAFKVGQQDPTHYLMARINRVRPEALSKMMPQTKGDEKP